MSGILFFFNSNEKYDWLPVHHVVSLNFIHIERVSSIHFESTVICKTNCPVVLYCRLQCYIAAYNANGFRSRMFIIYNILKIYPKNLFPKDFTPR